MGGEDMPNAVIASMLTGADVGQVVGLVNLTPYEGTLESTILKRATSDPGHLWRSLSLSTDLTVSQFAEKSSALLLMEDIKCWNWWGTLNYIQCIMGSLVLKWNYISWCKELNTCRIGNWVASWWEMFVGMTLHHHLQRSWTSTTSLWSLQNCRLTHPRRVSKSTGSHCPTRPDLHTFLTQSMVGTGAILFWTLTGSFQVWIYCFEHDNP